LDFCKNLLDLLADVLKPLNESGGFFDRIMIMGRVFLFGGKRKCNINGYKRLESQPHLKWDMVDGDMESLVVTVLNIVETLIPCTWMVRVVHSQEVHNHFIDDLCLAICLGVESSVFCELGVQQ
jgi:hypothetical protein